MQNLHELLDHGGLEQLAAFVAVAEAGSFKAAAEKIGRDASVISRRVTQIEKKLGVRLLSRTTRRIALTEAGAGCYHRVTSLLDELASASQELSDTAEVPQGQLKVSVPVTFGRQWVAPHIPAFLKTYPQIRIDAHFTDRLVDVVAENFDVAIRLGKLRDSSMMARRLGSYQNVLVASPCYLKEHGTPKQAGDLSHHACLGFSGHADWPHWLLVKNGKRRTIRPKGSFVADNSEAVLMAAMAGTGIAFTPDWLAGPALRSGKLVIVLKGWTSKEGSGIYAIMPPGRLIPAKSRCFVDELAQKLKCGWKNPPKPLQLTQPFDRPPWAESKRCCIWTHVCFREMQNFSRNHLICTGRRFRFKPALLLSVRRRTCIPPNVLPVVPETRNQTQGGHPDMSKSTARPR